MRQENNRAVEMTVPWKAWKTNPRFSTLPTAPWKSLLRFPHSHSPGDESYLSFTAKPEGRGASPLAYELQSSCR
jgi:hypothetical protein